MSEYDDLIRTEIKVQPNTLPQNHPLKNPKNHEKLFKYLMARLEQGKKSRDAKLTRMVAIDRSVSGWMQLTEADRERKLKQHQTGIPQATLMNLPISQVQLDDMMTYFAETFSPGRGMFYQTGKPDEVDASAQIVALMNNHSIYAGYYRELCLSVWATLKYNLGGLTSDWEEEKGPKISVDANQNMTNTPETVWAGNRVLALDMYNTFFDPTVSPDKVYCDGEWGATTKLVSHYWLANKAELGEYYNIEGALDSAGGTSTFYKHPPSEVKLQGSIVNGQDGGATTNWVEALADSPNYMLGNLHEITRIQIRIRPGEFGLVPQKEGAGDKYEIWMFTILNGKNIIAAKRKTNVHNHIPMYIGSVNDTGLGQTEKSIAELFEPIQTFASHLINIHIRGTRKNLKGLTVYDPSMVNLSAIPDGEVSANVPLEPSGAGKDVRTAIWTDDKKVDTSKTMQDLESVLALLNTFFPTQAAPSQIANIDRAVSNQVTAVQQGANRRLHKAAALLDVTMLTPMRFGLYYNILQFQQDGAEVSDYRGRNIKIDLNGLRETDLPFVIGMGLKAIDRMMIADKLQQVIFALIQNPNSAARVDVLAMIDYWTSMLDVDIDFKRFEIPAPQGTPTEPGAEPASGTGVQPITNPQAVTAPIYGVGAGGSPAPTSI